MGRNIAEGFATQTLLYWAPVPTGSGMKYDMPVEFAGAYIGNARLGDGGPSDVVFSGPGVRENMVLFYMCEPIPDGYVCWKRTLAALEADGTVGLPPDQIPETHKIRAVIEFVMPGATEVTLEDQAFIATVL